MAKIGILGDGQLGWLTALAAQKMGHETIVYGNEGKQSPAGQVSKILSSCGYDENCQNIEKFIQEQPDVITSEWENIPVPLIKKFENAGLIVRPKSGVFHIIQNRITEKNAVNNAGAKTAPYCEIKDISDLKYAHKDLGNGILKTATDGYDGKGQMKINQETDIEEAMNILGGKQLIYEKMIDFKMEISVIVARRPSGKMIAFEAAQNIHENGILKTTITPAPIEKETSEKAKQVAKKIAESLGIEGLLAVEMFVLENGDILINELAPRPHNSGHPTIESYNQSQYNILIKAILNEPFGELELRKSTTMHNLIGKDINQIRSRKEKKAGVVPAHNKRYYDYGKQETKPGRKMGHVVIGDFG